MPFYVKNVRPFSGRFVSFEPVQASRIKVLPPHEAFLALSKIKGGRRLQLTTGNHQPIHSVSTMSSAHGALIGAPAVLLEDTLKDLWTKNSNPDFNSEKRPHNKLGLEHWVTLQETLSALVGFLKDEKKTSDLNVVVNACGLMLHDAAFFLKNYMKVMIRERSRHFETAVQECAPDILNIFRQFAALWEHQDFSQKPAPKDHFDLSIWSHPNAIDPHDMTLSVKAGGLILVQSNCPDQNIDPLSRMDTVETILNLRLPRGQVVLPTITAGDVAEVALFRKR